MKQILLFIMICIAMNGYSQTEFNTKFKAIPPINKPKKVVAPPQDAPKIIPPNVFNNTNLNNTKPKPDNSFQMGETKGISMIKINDFINPGDEVRDRLNSKNTYGKEDNSYAKFYRKNQDLGAFRTKSISAKVLYRDAQYVDGDVIRVYLNDKVIQTEVTLEGEFKGFEITLQTGFNKIDFEALNQGTSGPNTAEFQVYDDKGKLISASEWNLGTGFKATIVLTKE